MVINLSGVTNSNPREYIKQEGHYTLKCIEIKFLRNSENNNPIYRFTFKNNKEEFFNDDITITPNTYWKIKQLSDAFGFNYDNVNIMHFKDMYLVAWLVSKRVKNKIGEIVEILECKQYTKSAKLKNQIPAEGSYVEPAVSYEDKHSSNIDIKIDDDQIPF